MKLVVIGILVDFHRLLSRGNVIRMAVIIARPITKYQLSCSNCEQDVIPKEQQDSWRDEKGYWQYSVVWYICPNCKTEFENTPDNPKFEITSTMDCVNK